MLEHDVLLEFDDPVATTPGYEATVVPVHDVLPELDELAGTPPGCKAATLQEHDDLLELEKLAATTPTAQQHEELLEQYEVLVGSRAAMSFPVTFWALEG